MIKTKWKVCFEFEDDFNEQNWIKWNGGTFMDAINSHYNFIKEDRIGKLECEADNCLPSNWKMTYTMKRI